MQKFTEFVKEHKSLLENKISEDKATKFNELYEAKLKEMGAKSPLDLSEEESKVFFEYLKSLKEAELTKADVKKAVKDETKDLKKKVDAAEDKAEAAEDTAKAAEKDAKKLKRKLDKMKLLTKNLSVNMPNQFYVKLTVMIMTRKSVTK